MNLWALKLDRKWLLLGKLRIIRLFHILFWWQLFDFCFLSFLFFRYSSVILSHIYLRKTPTTLKTLLKYRTNSFCNFKSHISEFFVIQSLKDEIQITERWDNNINKDISSIYHQDHLFCHTKLVYEMTWVLSQNNSLKSIQQNYRKLSFLNKIIQIISDLTFDLSAVSIAFSI